MRKQKQPALDESRSESSVSRFQNSPSGQKESISMTHELIH
ncbi:hypothetical protein ACLKMH_07435 [Psychromonas sp. KJ10-10]